MLVPGKGGQKHEDVLAVSPDLRPVTSHAGDHDGEGRIVRRSKERACGQRVPFSSLSFSREKKKLQLLLEKKNREMRI